MDAVQIGELRISAVRSLFSMRNIYLFRHPALNLVPWETPVGPNSKARNLARLRQLVNRRRMDLQHLTDLSHGKDFKIACHEVAPS